MGNFYRLTIVFLDVLWGSYKIHCFGQCAHAFSKKKRKYWEICITFFLIIKKLFTCVRFITFAVFNQIAQNLLNIVEYIWNTFFWHSKYMHWIRNAIWIFDIPCNNFSLCMRNFNTFLLSICNSHPYRSTYRKIWFETSKKLGS